MTTLEKAVEFFKSLRYESSFGGQRGLLSHHIKQFSAKLAVLLDHEISSAEQHSYGEGFEDGYAKALREIAEGR
jgi:hypothetical protein